MPSGFRKPRPAQAYQVMKMPHSRQSAAIHDDGFLMSGFLMSTTPSLGALLLLVIVHFGVDFPQSGLVRLAADDIVHGHHRGEHRVVLIVVPVHAVAADQEQV